MAMGKGACVSRSEQWIFAFDEVDDAGAQLLEIHGRRRLQPKSSGGQNLGVEAGRAADQPAEEFVESRGAERRGAFGVNLFSVA